MIIGANVAIQSSVEAGLGVAPVPTAAGREGVRQRHRVGLRTPATPVHRRFGVMGPGGAETAPAVARFFAGVAGIDAGRGPGRGAAKEARVDA